MGGLNAWWCVDCYSPYLSFVTDNVLLPFEGLCAAVAGEKPLGTVDMLFVDLQVAAVCKGLLADLTAVDDICFNSMVCTNNEHSGRLQYWNTNVLVLVTIRYLLFIFFLHCILAFMPLTT